MVQDTVSRALQVATALSKNGDNEDHFMATISEILESQMPQPPSEFHCDEDNLQWIHEIAALYVPASSRDASGEPIEIHPEAGFVRCRWQANGDKRWLDLSVSRSSTPDNSCFHVNLHIVKKIDPISIYSSTISLLRLFPDAPDPYIQFISERRGRESEMPFAMELHRSGTFACTGR